MNTIKQLSFTWFANKTSKRLKILKRFACPSCTHGNNIYCGFFKEQLGAGEGFRCSSYNVGEYKVHVRKTIKEMPVGFNVLDTDMPLSIWFFENKTWATSKFDENLYPILKSKQDGFIFVKILAPIQGRVQTHVIGNTVDFDKINCREI